jgi:anthranilate phosphoribosyltransferase
VASGGTVRVEKIDPRALSLTPCGVHDLAGGDAARNAEVLRAVVGGETGPVRDTVLVNAAGAIAAFRGLSGDLTADLTAGMAEAAQAIDSGRAAELLDTWIARSSALHDATLATN